MGSARAYRLIVASWVVLGVLALASRVGTPTPENALTELPTTATPTTTTPTTTTPTTTAPATAPPTTATPTTRLRSATLAFTGDVLIHSRVWQAAAAFGSTTGAEYDFAPMFEPVAPWIAEADWAVCHMEVNLSADNTRLSSYPVFKGPGTVAADLARVGYDSCSTASNHSLDGGSKATYETIEVLEAAGLRHSGTARSPEEAAATIWLDVQGIRIAHLAYAYWFNGYEVPAGEPWTANEIDEERILADAAAARAEGADLVMLSLHWGNQYRHEPSRQQAELGPRLLASADVDLIIGHHAHVVQPIEKIDGEWLVYGIGNMIANQVQLPRRDELLVTASIEEQADGSFAVDLDVLPMHLDTDTLTVWPSGPGLRPPGISDTLAARLDASWERTNGVLATGSGWNEFDVLGG